MYFLPTSPWHGQGTSFWPGSSGAPTECMQGMNGPSPRASSTRCPIRVMIFMCTVTYAESVICTPMCAIGEPIGPIEKGITYIVRPRMQPSNRPRSVARIFAGSSQLFVGPASSFVFAQMKVRASTRATSLGWERARNECGRFAGFRRTNVPASTNPSHSASYSSSDPSHQWTDAGLQRSSIASTHARRRLVRRTGRHGAGHCLLLGLAWSAGGFARSLI